jgi:hypothetical protein
LAEELIDRFLCRLPYITIFLGIYLVALRDVCIVVLYVGRWVLGDIILDRFSLLLWILVGILVFFRILLGILLYLWILSGILLKFLLGIQDVLLEELHGGV